MTRPSRSVPAVLFVLVALAAAACSDGGGSGGVAGGPRRATGKPLVLGLMNQESGSVGGFPEIRAGVDAAVRYVNEERRGIGNRPIQLETCATDGTDGSAEACARQLLAKQPVAVLGGIDVAAAAGVDVLEEAKVPYIGVTPSLGDELTNTNAFMLAGGVVADLLAETEYLTASLKATRVGVVHLDLGGFTDAAVLAAQAILRAKGVTDQRIAPEKPDATDFTAAVKTATAGNPDVLLAVFSSSGCVGVLKAAKALKVKAKILLPSACATQPVFDAVGTADVTFATAFVPYTDGSDPDVAVYRAKISGTPSVLSQAGFALVMDVQRLLSAQKADKLTAAAVTKAVKGIRNQPGFMGHEYTCDGQTLTILPAICNAWVRLVVYRGGNLEDVGGGWVTGAPLIKLLTG